MSTRTYRTGLRNFGPRRRIRRILCSGLTLLLLAKTGLRVQAQEGPADSGRRVQIPLFAEAEQSFSGALAARDYFVQLPEHIALRRGSELQLQLHPAPELVAQVCAVRVAVNDRIVGATNFHGVAGAEQVDPVSFNLAVPEEALAAGWNKVSLQLVLHPIRGASRDLDQQPGWTVRRAESYLSLAFERLPLFPALARFPQSFAEERLLRPDADSSSANPGAPVLCILVPGRSLAVHLRAAAIVGARLGQLGYLGAPHCRLEALESWKKETEQRDGLIIGRRDQLGGVELPSDVAAALASLGGGRGLLAEFLHGPITNRHRLLLVSGADDPGLEKAALTLGSAPALAEVLTNPAIIEQAPGISAELEAQARPAPQSLRLSDGAPMQLRGVYRSEQSFSNWRLPPGSRLGPDSFLQLRFTASPRLVKERSVLEILLNGMRVATLPVDPAGASAGPVRLPLPRGLPGRDPMNLIFRARLDLGEVDCAERQEENAWVTISADSTIEANLEPSPMEGLNQVQQFLLGDPFARQAAFLVPASPSLEQVRALFALWLDLGRNLPSSPVLWPEVLTYRSGSPPDVARLKGRCVLLLGAVAQWPDALPPAAEAPALFMTSPESRFIQIQSRRYEVAAFESTLVFAQWFRSPWSKDQTLVAAGGWKDYATPALQRLLLDPASTAQLHGHLVAFDSSGRGAAYESRRVSSESFAERIQRRIPRGLSVEETARRVAREEGRWTQAREWNRFLFLGFGSLLLLLVLSRLGLMWEQVRRRKKFRQADRATGGTA